jgi:heme exporter protein D
MQWWAWVVVALAVLALLVVAVLTVQARRRRGGVIVDPSRRPNRQSGRNA